MIARTEITVTHISQLGTVSDQFTELEPAVRFWNQQNFAAVHRNTLSTPLGTVEGGIGVRQYDADGNCVRDGWILHLFDGQTYLNPNIQTYLNPNIQLT